VFPGSRAGTSLAGFGEAMTAMDGPPVVERLAFHSELGIEPLCAAIQRALALPPFQFDAENETAWGACHHDGVEYNISMPYEDGTLQEWDETVPGGCNVGLSLLIDDDHPRAGDPGWLVGTLVRSVGERLAAALGRTLVHHRTSASLDGDAFHPHVFEPPGGTRPPGTA
jgi:hypothetical protein